MNRTIPLLVFIIASSCLTNSQIENKSAIIFPNRGYPDIEDDYFFYVNDGKSSKTPNNAFLTGSMRYNFGSGRIFEHLAHRNTGHLHGMVNLEEIFPDTIQSFYAGENNELIKNGQYSSFDINFATPSLHSHSVYFETRFNPADSMFYRDSTFHFIYDFDQKNLIQIVTEDRPLFTFQKLYLDSVLLTSRTHDYYSPERMAVFSEGNLYSYNALTNTFSLIYENDYGEIRDFMIWDDNEVLILKKENDIFSFLFAQDEGLVIKFYSTQEDILSIDAISPQQDKIIFRKIKEYPIEGTVPQSLSEIYVYDRNTGASQLLFGYQNYMDYLPKGDINWHTDYWIIWGQEAFSYLNFRFSDNGKELYFMVKWLGVFRINLYTKKTNLIVQGDFPNNLDIIALSQKAESHY
jgi:hypothetical protein